MNAIQKKSGSFVSFGKLVIATLAVSFHVSAAQAVPVYEYENTPAATSIMNDYSVSWDANTETMGISSSWDASANIDQISFLISDGGSPILTREEQFLWYSIDIANKELTVSNYFGKREPLQTFTNNLNITSNSIDLVIDSSYLNSLTAADFPGYSDYKGAGFAEDLGIWYYMHSEGKRVETLDVHYAVATEVSEPATFALLGLGLVGLGLTRKRRNA